MESLLNELDINLTQLQLNEDKDDEITDIFSYIGDEKLLTKIEVFDRLVEYTLKYHSEEMGELKNLFPEKINTIPDWKELVPEKSNKGVGKDIETCIINWARKQEISAKDIANTGRGQDAIIGGKRIEIKSSQDNKINTLLQTTYYSADKFYVFVTNTLSKDIEVRIVYGALLRKLSFGQELSKITDTEELGKELEAQIKDGLTKLDFTNMIKTSLVHGPTDRETSFFIANKLKVRFVIFLEPAYGKGKSNKNTPPPSDKTKVQ